MPAPKKNVAYSFDVMLPDSANPGKYKSNPTLAAGDVKVTSDEGALANITSLPTVSPAAGRNVKVSLSQTEMNADRISIVFSDQTVPQEWDDLFIFLCTESATLTDIDGRIPSALASSGNIKADIDTIKTNPVVNAGTVTFPTTATLASTTNITSVGAVTGAVGSVTGAVGSVTAGVTVTTNNDKTGYGLSAAAVQAVWDALTSALTTAGSIGKYLLDHIVGTLAAGTHNPQTGDAYARLGAPVGASISADIAAVKTQVTSTGVALTSAERNSVADALLDRTDGVETSVTVRQSLRLANAANGGKTDGMATTTAHLRDLADTKNRVTATVDANGNRTAVTRDLT
jgi:hypothetical protein